MLLESPKRKRGYKKERILRVLLNNQTDTNYISKYKVAKLTDTSEAWCHEYIDRLENKGLLDDTKILDIHSLYDEWRKTRIEPKQYSISLQKPIQILEETNLDYALTTYQAENLHQSFLFPSTTDFYIKTHEAKDWTQIIKNKGLIGGGNTRIRITDEHVFYNIQNVNGLTTVSIPQLIVDLLDEGGPCEEAAIKLIEHFHNP